MPAFQQASTDQKPTFWIQSDASYALGAFNQLLSGHSGPRTGASMVYFWPPVTLRLAAAEPFGFLLCSGAGCCRRRLRHSKLYRSLFRCSLAGGGGGGVGERRRWRVPAPRRHLRWRRLQLGSPPSPAAFLAAWCPSSGAGAAAPARAPAPARARASAGNVSAIAPVGHIQISQNLVHLSPINLTYFSCLAIVDCHDLI